MIEDTLELPGGHSIPGHTLLRPLGAGGFGAVYEALDEGLERRVAVKLLHEPTAALMARFRDEARLLARIDDPHVVQVHRVDTLPDGNGFIIMELFGDVALSGLYPPGRVASPEAAVSIIAQVLRGLGAAHRVGVVHRDVKPANVLVERHSGRAKVCDFGIARSLEPMPGQADPTGRQLIGTPRYMAPERFKGVNDDPRSDLFAVGIMLYELLSGQRPFEGPGDILSIAQRVHAEQPPPLAAPPALARVCSTLLQKDRALRYATAEDALVDLERSLSEAPTLLPVEASPAKRGVAPALLALVLGVLVLGLALWARPAKISAPDAALAPASVAPAPDAHAHAAARVPDAALRDAAPKATSPAPPKAAKPVRARARPAQKPAPAGPKRGLDRRDRGNAGADPFVEGVAR